MNIRVHQKNILRYFPKSILKLIRNPGEDLDINSGEYSQNDICVLFADIRNFSGISENLESDNVFLLMNDFIKQIIPAITENGGIVDKFIGDAFLAIFPLSANSAVQSAVNIMQRLDIFNESIRDKEYYPLQIGIGIHKGNCTIGVIGNDTIHQVAILGDAVNLSSRIESATKTYKAPILISDSVYSEIKNTADFNCREIDTVRVKGKDHAVVLYEICNCNSEKVIEQKRCISEDYANALSLYKSGNFNESKMLLEKCQEIFPEDPILQIYIKRCGTFLRMPPGDDWSGITGIL